MTVPHNHLDTQTNLLYCSRRCALQAGASRKHLARVSPQKYKESFVETEVEYGTWYKSPWGAVCRECAQEYRGYPAIN